MTNTARLAACPIAEGGTPLELWTSWGRRFADLEVAACPGLAIVAPHPDDETLGLGATAAMLHRAGVEVHVISVTDGGAAHWGGGATDRARLEAIRCAEVRRAAAILGIAEPIRLGLPDGDLVDRERNLADHLSAALSCLPRGSWCAATWRGDGHPDHEAVGRAAAVAAERAGAVFFEYPVWMWHWGRPDDDAVPWQRARRVPVSDAALEAKHRAVQCFSSQIQPTAAGGPVLPAWVVQRLQAVGELVFA